LIKIATDTGSIRWAKAELVYSNDTFTYKGVNIPPAHEFNPFGDRGEFIGVYCVAKTSDGDFLCETMTAQEIHDIRNKSEAFKAFASGKASQCPWHDFFGEMTKKTCIKRASKTWPKSQRGDMLQNAIAILNEHEGIDFTDGSVVETKTQEQIDLEQYQALCDLYADTILAVKEGIANDDYSSAAEVWFTVGDDHETTLRIHESLWRSTKRGGCFTTAERDIIKSSEFRKAYYGETA
jgi:recombination protein RecT